jgi:hypothetical protein
MNYLNYLMKSLHSLTHISKIVSFNLDVSPFSIKLKRGFNPQLTNVKFTEFLKSKFLIDELIDNEY